MKIKLPNIQLPKYKRSEPDLAMAPSTSSSRLGAAAPGPGPGPGPDVAIGGLGDRMRLVNRRLRGMAGYVFLFLFVLLN